MSATIKFFCKTLYDDWYEINLNSFDGEYTYEIIQCTPEPKDITTNYYRNITKSLYENHRHSIYTALDNLTNNKLIEVYTYVRNPYEEAPLKIQKRSLPSSSGDGRSRRKPKKSGRRQRKKSKKIFFSSQKDVSKLRFIKDPRFE